MSLLKLKTESLKDSINTLKPFRGSGVSKVQEQTDVLPQLVL